MPKLQKTQENINKRKKQMLQKKRSRGFMIGLAAGCAVLSVTLSGMLFLLFRNRMNGAERTFDIENETIVGKEPSESVVTFDSPESDAAWKNDYIEKIRECQEEIYSDDSAAEYNRYGLAYIDEDDIPELVIVSGTGSCQTDVYSYGGEMTFHLTDKHVVGGSIAFYQERVNQIYVLGSGGMTFEEDGNFQSWNSVEYWRLNEQRNFECFCVLEMIFVEDEDYNVINELTTYNIYDVGTDGSWINGRKITEKEYNSYQLDMDSGNYAEIWDAAVFTADELTGQLMQTEK